MTNRYSVFYGKAASAAPKLPPWRARFVLLTMVFGMLVLLIRGVYLQGINNGFLQAKGESRYVRELAVPATRGRITDRHGRMLAVSTPVKSIWAVPEDADLSPAQMRELASLLGMDVNAVNQRLDKAKNFVYLKRQLSPEIGRKIAELELPGVHQEQEYRRYYPSGEVSAHILGFTGVADDGQEGVELAFNTVLKGVNGSRRVLRDRRGQIIDDVAEAQEPQNGQDIALSIDSRIQYMTYSILNQAVEKNKARAGAAVVLDVHTGEILALVNVPTFNPNNRVGLSGAQLRNRALTDVFEPGSTIKPFTVALALERGLVTPNTVIDTGGGKLTINRATISDIKGYGKLTVAQVIKKSSNIGTVKVTQNLSSQDMWSLFDTLGFSKVAGLGFPGEAKGHLRSAKQWRPIEHATMSYGYGLSMSLMHLARAYQIFAREGDYMPLSLLRVDHPDQSRAIRVLSPQVALEMRHMLEEVTEQGGTGTRARVPGYRVAGKSGTAHKLENGQYAKKYIASFAGFAPVSNPRIVVAIMIDEPSAGQHYGGAVVGPAFSSITEEALRALGVATDAPLEPLKIAGQKTRGTAEGPM